MGCKVQVSFEWMDEWVEKERESRDSKVDQ